MSKGAEHLVLRNVGPGRSCLACKRRKIRCDRGQPCGYCVRLNTQCVYPENDQSEKRAPDADVLTRLGRIEVTLARLESHITNSGQELGQTDGGVPSEGISGSGSEANDNSPIPASKLLPDGDCAWRVESFWAQTDQEITDEDPAGIDIKTPIPSADRSSRRREKIFVFEHGLSEQCLTSLHPSPDRMFAIWQLFLDGVDPLLKLLHVPTAQRQLMQACGDLGAISPSFESLLFAIYYSAAASIQCSAACRSILKEEQEELLDRYSFGIERALAKANFIGKPDILSLQALVLYLISARNHAEGTFVWTMTGTAIRLATKLGLHRDPASLGLSPFACEIRRRLWWHILILDVRTAEESDMDPSIYEQSFDTKLPSNVNDSELDVHMAEPIAEGRQPRRTELAFALQRFEISYAARKILFSSRFTRGNGYPTLTLDEKNLMMDRLYDDLRNRYHKHCDDQVPICFVMIASAKLVISKIKLTIYHPAQNESPEKLKRSLHELMETCFEIVERTRFLRNHVEYSKWMWLFQRYIEWDAVACLLRSVPVSTNKDIKERAWQLIDTFFDDWEVHVPDEGIGGRWQRLQALRSRAQGTLIGDSTKRPVKIKDSALVASTASSNQAQAASSSSTQPPLNLHCMEPDTHTDDIQLPMVGNEAFTQHGNAKSNAVQPPVQFPGESMEHSEELSSADHEAWGLGNVPFYVNKQSWDMDVDDSVFESWIA